MTKFDELDRAIIEYLKSRDSKWYWVLGNRILSRDETIDMYEKDYEFRRLLREHVFKLAVELFTKYKNGDPRKDESGIRKA